MLKDWCFYFITDAELSTQGIIHDAEAAIQGGARVIQYRRKNAEEQTLHQEALVLRKLTNENSVDLIINDCLDIALAVGADGVHLGQDDLACAVARTRFPRGIIGVSVNKAEEARKALSDGADYIAVGPMWATGTKKDAREPVGPRLLGKIRALTDKHITAIGGITLENLPKVLKAGADSACAISATVGHEDIEERVRRFDKAIRTSRS